MAAQGCLGAFDTLYHHELTEALPHRPGAARELSIHAGRALIYSALFIGLSSWAFHGVWALVLLAVFVVEIGLTLWDFVIEDRTRLLPATERVTHTVLVMNGGAFIALLALNTPAWWQQPTALVWQPNGALGVFLALCGIGVGISGVRDALAARAIGRRMDAETLDFGDPGRSFLVTGATGFIGQLLVHALLRAGQRVTVLSRQPRQAAWTFDGRVHALRSRAGSPGRTADDAATGQAGTGRTAGGGGQWLSWIHVDDLLRAIAHLCVGDADGSYNFTAPESVPQRDFSRTAASVARRPYGMPTPGWPVRLVLGEQADLLLEGQRVAPVKLLGSGFVVPYPRLTPALASLA